MTKKEIKNTNKNYGQSIPDGPTFSGPDHKRSFTDVICCLIFVAAMVGYVILGGAAWLYGNPQYITKEQNSAGAFCGMGPNFDKPNLFYFNILKCALAVNVTASTFKGLQCPTTQVCIKNCPSTFWFLPQTAFSAGAKPSEFFQQEFCDPSLDLAQTTFTVQEILDKGLCPAYYTPSTLVQGKCLPSFDPKDVPVDFNFYKSTFGNDTVKVIMDTSSSLGAGFNLKSRTVRIIEDLAITWYWILVGLVIALVVSLVLLLLMRCCVSLVSILFHPGLLSLGAYGIYQCYQYEKDINSQLTLGDLSFQSKMSEYLQVKGIWLGCIVTVCLLEFILVMLFISYLRKGLTAALALMKECSKAMGVLSSTMAYPLVTFLLVMLCMTFFIVTNVNLVTSGLPVYKKLALNTSNANCTAVTGEEKCVPEKFKASDYPTCPVRCVFVRYDEEEGFFQRHAQNFQIYNLLACLWCLNFIITLGQCTLARTFSSYYWSLSNLQNIHRSIVSKALFQMLRYHTGSMAFGAIFVNMFQGIRMFLEFLKDVTRGGQRCCCCCMPLMMPLKCCFCVLDKVLKYFTRNTYIMIATHGDNFFTSAKNAHMLCERNKDRVRMVDRTTDWLLFFGRLLVVGAIGVLAFYFFNGDIPVSADIFQVKLLSFRWLHFTVVIVGTYFIAEGCFSVYSIGVDTFTICVMDDLERNDGTFQRPYMSRTLQQILQLQDDPVL
ncbi:choline transporter-like protein 4 isoform X2 [Tachysurus fulvidraco]|nr:choline transporter-like protein 4 isoform X2 [Tachysurus fulvidraco]XP_026995146.2 choline transporter-like protein 4 isoform X2 [Tachysurus fulvidraco]